MIGLVVLAAAGVVAWKYRDSLREYVRGNVGPAKSEVDELLRTAQQKSETLLEQAKERLASGFGSMREKVNPRSSDATRERPTE